MQRLGCSHFWPRPMFPLRCALPGAIDPTPEGSVAPSTDEKIDVRGRRAGPAITPKPPSEDLIIGHALHLDGSRSSIEFQRSGADLQVAKLALTGDRLMRSGEACRVEVAEPLGSTSRRTRTVLRRYEIDFPACPFTFDVLDGAILVSNDGKVCEIKQADCRADPDGLWGMEASEFDPKRASEMLTLRARVEQTVRNIFKALYDKIKSDKAICATCWCANRRDSPRAVKRFAAPMSQEADFGYCALRVTEARALALGTQLAKGVKKPGGVETAEGGVGAKGKSCRR